MSHGTHPAPEVLQDLLDDRLDAAGRRAALDHLAACATCRGEWEALRWVKESVLQPLPETVPPPELATRIGAALDGEDRAATRAHSRSVRRRAALAGGLLAAAAIVVLAVWSLRSTPLPAAAAGQFAALGSPAAGLAVHTSDAATLEAYFRDDGLTFPTRVFDFGMMGYALEGGRVWTLAGRPAAVFAYRNAAGDRLVCEMYEGTLAELPVPLESHTHDGITFQVYRQGRLTLVFWEEGPVVCVLMSDGDPAEALALARAKAVRV